MFEIKKFLSMVAVFISLGWVTTSLIMAQDTGSVSGVITNQTTGDPIVARVEVLDQNGDTVIWTQSNSDGTYLLSEISAGDYKVKFSSTDLTVEEYYDDKPDFASGDWITIEANQTTTGISAQLDVASVDVLVYLPLVIKQPPPAPTATPDNQFANMSGTVTDAESGQPLEGIAVFVEDPTTGAGGISAAPQTDANGNYNFDNFELPAGSYKIRFSGTDIHPDYPDRYYNNKPDFASADIVTLTGGQTTTGINAQLQKQASGLDWEAQTSNTSQDLLAVSCSSANHCVGVGKAGTIVRTTNGGTTWETKSSGTNQQMNGVNCPSNTFCVAVGNNGTILISRDGGQSWDDKNTSSTDWLAVDCGSTNLCLSVGGVSFVATVDGGNSWSPPPLNPGNTPLYGIDCPNENLCFLVGLGRTVRVIVNPPSIATHNEGQVFHHDIDCPDGSTTCFMVSDKGEIRFTTNSHTDWQTQNSGTGQDLKGVDCVSLSECYTVGGSEGTGIILKTENGGTTWNSQTLEVTKKMLRGVSCALDNENDTICFAVGDSGTILAY